MKRYYLFSLISFFLLSACATASERSTDEAMLNFLPYLNQKVAGYLDSHDNISLDIKTYKNIVNEVCVPLQSCGTNAELMFNAYDVQVRALNGMFSIMLCDKDRKTKKMEDFSCNEQKVEVPSFKNEALVPCAFELRWNEQVAPYCPELK